MPRLRKLLDGIRKKFKQKREPRNHPYEEIDDEQLAANRSNQNGASPNQQAEPEEDPDYDDAQSQMPTETTVPRYHPYDEVDSQTIERNRKAQKQNKKKKNRKGSTPNGKASAVAQGALAASEEVEYQNISPSKEAGRSNPFDKDPESVEEVEGMYAQPKKQLKTKDAPSQLNYVEVEFTPGPAKPEPKRTYTPTNYTKVVNDNGKVILLNQT